MKEYLNRDVKLGVFERVQYGKTTDWYPKMMVIRETQGNCLGKTMARSVPVSSYKSVFDAWIGHHSVSIRKDYRHYL